MSVIIQIASVIAALVLGYWGATYLAGSADSNSAIHEMAGMVGLAFALLFVGLAVALFKLGALEHRIDGLHDAVQDAAGESSAVRRAKASIGPAGVLLVALSQAGGALPKHREMQRLFLRKATPKVLNSDDEDEMFAWLQTQPRDGESLARAISSVAALSSPAYKEFRHAAEQIVRHSTAEGRQSDAQAALLDRTKLAA